MYFQYFSQTIFEKYWNITFYENTFSGSRVVPCRQTDKTKLTFAVRSFSNAPNKQQHRTFQMLQHQYFTSLQIICITIHTWQHHQLALTNWKSRKNNGVRAPELQSYTHISRPVTMQRRSKTEYRRKLLNLQIIRRILTGKPWLSVGRQHDYVQVLKRAVTASVV